MPKKISSKTNNNLLGRLGRMTSKTRFIVFVAVFAVLGGAYLAYSGFALVPRADVRFSNIQVGKITPGSGHVGVDIWYKRNALFQDKSGIYNPCHDKDNESYSGCQLSKNGPISYYKVLRFSPEGTNFPYGIFIDNSNDNRCTTGRSWCSAAKTLNHDWGRLVTGGSLEIYPHLPGTTDFKPAKGKVGGVRIYVDGFPIYANGGRYSVDIGDIKLPQFGDPDVGKMNGLVFENGKRVKESRVSFDFYQNGGDRKTSTGYGVSGFSASNNNKNGYYTSGAIPNGSYKLYVTDNETGQKIILDGLEVEGLNRRMDFELTEECFGWAKLGCVVDTHPANR